MAARSSIGASLVASWAQGSLPSGASILDVGCGSGVPVAQALAEGGFPVWGVDASPTLVAAFHRRFPQFESRCEAAQDSTFFDRTFEGAIAIGLLFLLSENDQRQVVHRIAGALKPAGRLLFSAPREPCEWQDMLTRRPSVSLGERTYERVLRDSGLQLIGCMTDEGGNNYYHAVKAVG